MQSTLTFTSFPSRLFKVTLPLANTLFKNSRQSTLLVSQWSSAGDSFRMNSEQTEMQNVDVQIFRPPNYQLPPNRIPAVPLTPLRRIESGLGNIVRSLDFGYGAIGPASRELEASVTEYLARRDQTRSTVAVWALVLPKDVESYPSEGLGHQYVGRCLERGATLCRVRTFYSPMPGTASNILT